ncbi:P-type conjugative transfer ATPase TrbB [Caulobacter segnis]|uniref:P-type conjugative transfer ATPase TrbB n=1 Tax=Caulobacter segnis TaxID=88688 RepID=UPI00286B8D0F|nr:P-type conjugative transfer ATPase TrbB [Caulobacter segnis]
MLRSALGPDVLAWLSQDDVVEVMLNPDGRLWVDRLGEGLSDTGVTLGAAEGERIIRLVAHHVASEAHAGSPRVSAELPETGERFEGLLPPIVAAPAFAIRKPAIRAVTLGDYVAQGVMSQEQADALAAAVAWRRNILVAGATASGKTTLANALLAELAGSNERVVVLEDTVELRCPAANTVGLRSKDGVASLTELLRSTLRLRPDRIVVGEVRGPEALDLVKAWGTGHPGGVATVHAGSPLGALRRLEQLIAEAAVAVPRELIAETIEVIAVLTGRGSARRLTDLVAVQGLSDGAYRFIPIGDAP